MAPVSRSAALFIKRSINVRGHRWAPRAPGAECILGPQVTDLPDDFQSAPLSEVDPDIARVLDRELARQQATLEMIASENFVPQAVLDAAGSVLTNKYAEGYPGKRYYGGCEEVDVAEQLAIDRAKALFGAEHANVQPHAGAQANNAAYMAMLDPGDTIMGMALDHGGHLTHGMKLNVSGKLYEVVAYHVRREDLLCDMDEVARLAEEHKPKVIVAGWSAYPRQLDFTAFREIADSVGAKLMVDMAHFAGLVAAGEHPNPVPDADVVTTTIHKTLCGPRSGMILCKEELAAEINRSVFPGQQGGPLMHIIAAKAVALKIAATEEFRARQRQTDRQRAGAGGGPRRRGDRGAHGGHRRPPGPRRSDSDRGLRQGGGEPPGGCRDHRQPKRDPLRRAQADGSVGPANRHPRAHHPRAGRGRLPRDRPGDRRGARSRLRVGEGRPPRAKPGADGSLSAVPAALRSRRLKIWADCTAAAHPLVLRPIIERLEAAGHQVEVTAREYGQTEGILERLGIPFTSVGRHGGRSAPGKVAALAGRSTRLWRWARGRGFDLALAHGSVDIALVSGALRIPSVQMNDYEHAGYQRRISFRAARLVIAPDAIPVGAMERAGARPDRLFRYPGLKEDYYLADFRPDPRVLEELELDADQVIAVVRPPPETSEYHAENPLYEAVIERLGGIPDAVAVVIPRTAEQAERLAPPRLPVAGDPRSGDRRPEPDRLPRTWW